VIACKSPQPICIHKHQIHVRIGAAYRLALCSACVEEHCQLVASLEWMRTSTSLNNLEHVAQHSTALSKDTAVLPIAVLPIAVLPIAVLPIAILPIAVLPVVSKSNVTHCRVIGCSSAPLAENADRLTSTKQLEGSLYLHHPGLSVSKLAASGAK
jgi:hypothetical protein